MVVPSLPAFVDPGMLPFNRPLAGGDHAQSADRRREIPQGNAVKRLPAQERLALNMNVLSEESPSDGD